ncbi:hypothetical protein RFI_12791 [Reticulomyxa filosa]|uniref:TRAF-type domain-containing protein n=1 Tax=Reticulomyxa filosa TaxID=46433 RepID=X6NEJ9_RETFI|nr:hypothetical protein RFI_12791 [Reticulomyxa filosa]|eukprot:ETO24366.1 hypothetical protein RFI_12791 [Reticulomyxa filosa]
MSDEKSEVDPQNRGKNWTEECFDKAWVLHLDSNQKIRDCICLVCRQIANNAMELSCEQHEDLDEVLIVGKNCLKAYLKKNGDMCPIEPHEDCKYSKTKLVQRQVGELMVMCPLQFKQDQLYPAKQLEGETLEEGNEQSSESRATCNFYGQLKDIKEHLDNDCPLTTFDCWYKLFGCQVTFLRCNQTQHKLSHHNQHQNLVMSAIQQRDEEIKRLRKENETQKLQEESLKKRNTECNQQLLQCQQELSKSTVSQVFFVFFVFRELQKLLETKTKETVELTQSNQTLICKCNSLLEEMEKLKAKLEEKESAKEKMELFNRVEPHQYDWDRTRMGYSEQEPEQGRVRLRSEMQELMHKSCEDIVRQMQIGLRCSFVPSLQNGVDFLLREENKQKIYLENGKWHHFQLGVYLLGEGMTLTVDCNNKVNKNEMGYLKIKTSHLWIKHHDSVIDCSGLGYSSNKGPGKGSSATYSGCGGGGAGHATNGGGDDIASGHGKAGGIYGEKTLLKELHCGSGGGSSFFYQKKYKGGRGGGIIHLVIEQQLLNQGVLRCDGASEEKGFGGGGSGGSILLLFASSPSSSTFQHTFGTITCIGGNTQCPNAGANGRIAIHGVTPSYQDIEKINPKPFYNNIVK